MNKTLLEALQSLVTELEAIMSMNFTNSRKLRDACDKVYDAIDEILEEDC